jgi:hypothetical protein
LFVGDDWAEDHHDVEVVDEQGRQRARRRLEERVVKPLSLTRWLSRSRPTAAMDPGTEDVPGLLPTKDHYGPGSAAAACAA